MCGISVKCFLQNASSANQLGLIFNLLLMGIKHRCEVRGGRLLSAKLHQKSLTLVGNFPENFRHLSYTFVFVKHSRYHCVKSVVFGHVLNKCLLGQEPFYWQITCYLKQCYLLPDIQLFLQISTLCRGRYLNYATIC